MGRGGDGVGDRRCQTTWHNLCHIPPLPQLTWSAVLMRMMGAVAELALSASSRSSGSLATHAEPR